MARRRYDAANLIFAVFMLFLALAVIGMVVGAILTAHGPAVYVIDPGRR